MAPIRVLHILHSMNRGGAENSIMNYYRNIDREKVQFDFLLTEQGESQFEKEISELGGRVFKVPRPTVPNVFPYVRGVRRFFRNHKEYRIVHSHTSSKSFLPLIIAKRAGIPVRICHSHNTRTEKGISGIIRDLLKIPLKMVATHLFACGEDAARWLYGNNMVDSGKVSIMPNVIECDNFSYNQNTRARIRSSLNISDNQILLGCVARFSTQKNHRFLISIFDSFHKKVTDSKLILLGEGELKDEIQSLVHSQGLDSSVFFTGVVPNVGEYLQAFDFYIMPSFYEGLPLSIIEAQIAGLRCFASYGVPIETDKTGLVSFLSLDEGPDYWVDRIIDSIGYERFPHVQELIDAGYDAATSSRKMQVFYERVYCDSLQ